MERFVGRVRKCLQEYHMIQRDDVVAVGVSGGKDSLALLAALHALRPYYPEPFELQAVTLDMGFPGMDLDPVGEYCARLGIPWRKERTELYRLIFEERREENPCALCSRMRRAALCDLARRSGAGKLALAHGFDDAVETFLMSLVFEGRLHCFDPVTVYDGVTVIRPMLYAGESAAVNAARELELPVVKSACPMDGHSRRAEMKELAAELSRQYPGFKSRVFGAMQRLPLYGWGVAEPGREDKTGNKTTSQDRQNTENGQKQQDLC